LNALLDVKVDHLCGARKYERTEGHKDAKAGSYESLTDQEFSTTLFVTY